MFLLLQDQLNMKGEMERLKVFWEVTKLEGCGHSTHYLCVFPVLFRLDHQIFFMYQHRAILEEIL